MYLTLLLKKKQFFCLKYKAILDTTYFFLFNLFIFIFLVLVYFKTKNIKINK